MGGGHKIISFKFNDPVGGGFVPPPDPFQERLYLLVQVQCGNPFQIQVPGSLGRQERGLEELLAGLEGGVLKVDAWHSIEPVGRGFGQYTDPL